MPSNSKIRVFLVRQVSVDPCNEFCDGMEEARVVKHILLGEGSMYTADMTRESITWAGEVAINPTLDIQHGGFRTHSIVVQVSLDLFLSYIT